MCSSAFQQSAPLPSGSSYAPGNSPNTRGFYIFSLLHFLWWLLATVLSWVRMRGLYSYVGSSVSPRLVPQSLTELACVSFEGSSVSVPCTDKGGHCLSCSMNVQGPYPCFLLHTPAGLHVPSILPTILPLQHQHPPSTQAGTHQTHWFSGSLEMPLGVSVSCLG